MNQHVRPALLPAMLVAFLLGFTPAGVWGDSTLQDFSADFPPPPPPLPYVANQVGAGDAPGVQTSGGWDGNFFRLTHAQNSQSNSLAFNQAASGSYESLSILFDFRVDNGPGGADGFGVSYLNAANFGSDTSTIAPGFSEEPNLAGSVGVGFDTFHNDGLDPLPGVNASEPNTVSLHFDGAKVDDVDISATAIPLLESSMPMTAAIDIIPNGSGSDVTVTITDGVNTIIPINNVNVPGLLPYDGRLAFHGRTGGANQNQDLDNILVSVTQGGSSTVVLDEDFTNPVIPPPVVGPTLLGGTPFTIEQRGGAPAAKLVNEGATPGPNPAFFRLAHESGGQFNVIAFDQTSTATGKIIADFDLRGLSEEGSRADGTSFLLVDTAAHGSSGGIPAFGGPAEEPNLAGAFGVGFDTFDNGDEGSTEPNIGNHVSLHWDGSELDRIHFDRAELDLVNNEFNHVTVSVDEVAGGSNVTVLITDGTDGSVHVPFADYFVAGMTFEGARAAFAGRTGGAFDNYDLDNVNIQFIPEPGMLGLAAISALAMLMIARRRQCS